MPDPDRKAASRRPITEATRLAADVRDSARPGRQQDASDAFERAVALVAEDDPEQAVLAATAAKRLAPRSAVVREILGIALYRSGRLREALSELLAYRRMSGRPDQNHLIADAYRAAGAPEKGLPLIREALTAPLPADVRAELFVVGGSTLADMGRFDEALGLLHRYGAAPGEIGSEDDLRVWYVAADVLERAGRRAEAAEAFELLLRHDPDSFDVRERLASLRTV